MYYYLLTCGCIYEDTQKCSKGELVECEFRSICKSGGGNQRVVREWTNSDWRQGESLKDTYLDEPRWSSHAGWIN